MRRPVKGHHTEWKRGTIKTGQNQGSPKSRARKIKAGQMKAGQKESGAPGDEPGVPLIAEEL
jgi:hypothetical protein